MPLAWASFAAAVVVLVFVAWILAGGFDAD